MAGRDKRARATGKLGMVRGERYALVPEEVMASAAYAALPDYSKVVLFALAARFHGKNNGNLSLTPGNAKDLGVGRPWKLYSGLKILRRTELIECTRQGRLDRGRKLCSLYALNWRPVDAPPSETSYDAGISTSSIASQAWARWEKPKDWEEICRKIAAANHGKKRDLEISVSPEVGNGRSPMVGTEGAISDHPRGVLEPSISVPPVGDFSKTSPGVHPRRQLNAELSVGAVRVWKMLTANPDFTDSELIRICRVTSVDVSEGRSAC